MKEHKINNSLFIIILASLAVCCIELPEESPAFQSELNIYSVLVPNIKKQVVIVDRTFDIDDNSDERISGAQVTITNGDTVVYFREDSTGFYSDTLNKFWVKPSVTYSLQVVYDDTVFAVTTIPDTFQIYYPQSGDTISLNDFVNWTECRTIEDREYFIDAIPDSFDSPHLPEVATTNTSIDFVQWSVFNPSGWYTILIMVMNKDYYDHSMSMGNIFREGNIQGGIGLFGAEVFDTVKVFIQPAEY